MAKHVLLCFALSSLPKLASISNKLQEKKKALGIRYYTRNVVISRAFGCRTSGAADISANVSEFAIDLKHNVNL